MRLKLAALAAVMLAFCGCSKSVQTDLIDCSLDAAASAASTLIDAEAYTNGEVATIVETLFPCILAAVTAAGVAIVEMDDPHPEVREVRRD